MKPIKKLTILILLIFPIFFSMIFKVEVLNQNRNFTIDETEVIEEIGPPISSDILVGDYIVPGIIGTLDPDQIIKIGVLDDLNRFGEHTHNGALLAAKEINQAGGVEINTSQYYVGISSENTDEQNYILDVSKGITAAENLLNSDPHFVIGGSRTEALLAYLEVIMDYGIPFIGTGCDADVFCQKVLDSYDRYKYFFRGMPVNSTSKAKEFLYFILTLVAMLPSISGGSGPVDKVAILREDLEWNIPWDFLLNNYLPMLGITVVADISFPLDATMVDFEFYMSHIQASGAQILIPLISSGAGILMDVAYENVQPRCLIAGLNRYAEDEAHWDNTQGACQYEIVMQNTFRTNKTSLTVPFWDAYMSEYGMEPYYTGVGAYDAIRLLTHVVNISKSFNPDLIVSALENVNEANPFESASGNIAFGHSHDLVEGWPYHNYLFCQWQTGGIKNVIPTFGTIYPDSIVTGPILIPPWGINEGGDPPGEFFLTSNANNPDTNGDFTLSWTVSEGAEEYSLYMSDSYISYINQDLDLISHQTDNTPVEINNLKTGEYFFITASYNSSGVTLSNCLQVNILRPSPGAFVLTTDADDPDSDGYFSLLWTPSEGAENYSIYKHSGFITEINETLEVLAYQNANSPFEITETEDGIYNYIVVASNATGTTLSNSVMVNVTFPPPEHDLTVYLEVPNSIKINFFYTLNATVKNQGLNNETDVELCLYLDGILIESMNIPFLQVGTSQTLQYLWNPTSYGFYNFTAYAPPVIGELIFSNNLDKSIIYLSPFLFDGLYIKHIYGSNPTFVDSNFTYSYHMNSLYNEIWNIDYMGTPMSMLWIVDSQTRLMSGGSVFGDGCHTPVWIFTNTSLSDTIPIAVDGEGDHLFEVTDEFILDLPGYGSVEVWVLEDITSPGSYAWYEKSTGILLHGLFYFYDGIYNYTFQFVDTNAQFGYISGPGPFTLSSNADNPDGDGIFTLFWTESEDATNYSIYKSDDFITEVTPGLTLIADGITDIEVFLEGYTDGDYYFIVVAQNNDGRTLSNCIVVTVHLELPPVIMYDTIPDESTLTYTRASQVIGSVAAYSNSRIIFVGFVGGPVPGFALDTSITTFDNGETYISETTLKTTNQLEPGVHELTIRFYTSGGQYLDKSFTITVYRQAELKLRGEFDYLLRERVRISIIAQAFDVEDQFLLDPLETGMIIHIKIIDYDGAVKVEAIMNYNPDGFFYWNTTDTIRNLWETYTEAIYIVQAWIEFPEDSYYMGGLDVIEFHIDPPGETAIDPWAVFILTSLVGLVGVNLTLGILLRRKNRTN